jgi:hypothetical protein
MKTIYEYDTPKEESEKKKTLQVLQNYRFKPNGITDGRIKYNTKIDWLYGGKFDEWRRQRLFAKENYQIDLMSGKIKIIKKDELG